MQTSPLDTVCRPSYIEGCTKLPLKWGHRPPLIRTLQAFPRRSSNKPWWSCSSFISPLASVHHEYQTKCTKKGEWKHTVVCSFTTFTSSTPPLSQGLLIDAHQHKLDWVCSNWNQVVGGVSVVYKLLSSRPATVLKREGDVALQGSRLVVYDQWIRGISRSWLSVRGKYWQWPKRTWYDIMRSWFSSSNVHESLSVWCLHPQIRSL